MNTKFTTSYFSLILILIMTGLSACASKSSSSPLNLPSTSPAKVVDSYLDALKKADFLKTYEFIAVGYAGNLDKESYKLNMEQGLLKKYNWSLLNYQITGVRILGDQAYVYTQLGVEFKPVNSESKVQRNIEVQYVLTDLEKKWKITGDSCLTNCMSPEDLIGKPANKPIDSN